MVYDDSCHLDRIQSHPRDRPLGMPVKGYLDLMIGMGRLSGTIPLVGHPERQMERAEHWIVSVTLCFLSRYNVTSCCRLLQLDICGRDGLHLYQ